MSESVTRSPIEMFGTAKKYPPVKTCLEKLNGTLPRPKSLLCFNFMEAAECFPILDPSSNREDDNSEVDRPTQLIFISDIDMSTNKYKRHSRAIC